MTDNIPRDKKFYKHGKWAEILSETSIHDLPRETFKRFVQDSIEDGHRREYYLALDYMDETGPDWEDLAPDQRENIRKINNQHQKEMYEFGRSLSS